MIIALVFLPLLAAIVAGLGNRAIGNVPAKVITTGDDRGEQRKEYEDRNHCGVSPSSG